MALGRILIAACVVLGTALPVHANDKTQNAVRTTEELLSRAHAALSASDRPGLLSAIDSAFAFDLWERFLIQNRKSAFNDAQKLEFRRLLPGFLAHLYNNQFQRGLSGAPTLGGTRQVRRDVMVASSFPRANGEQLPVDWRIRERPGHGSEVVDIMVAGISFALQKQDEFTAIIDKGGADALLEHMRAHSF